MKNITLAEVIKLHKETGRGLYYCKQALQNSDTLEEAKDLLEKMGVHAIQRNNE